MELLRARQKAGFHVCVGLDSDTFHAKFPECLSGEDVASNLDAFNTAIIDSTADIVACYKFNLAFYSQHGPVGLQALLKAVSYIQECYPGIPIILDGKRGDIGNTNDGYVREIFEVLKGDAITVPPYMGEESLRPFLNRTNKGIFVLAKTSNKGAGELEDLPVLLNNQLIQELFNTNLETAIVRAHSYGWFDMYVKAPLHEYVTFRVAHKWNTNGNCGIVFGATQEGLERARMLAGPDVQILIPGVGAQGGSLEGAVHAASQWGSTAYIINSSRGVIFASSGEDFPKAARAEVERMNMVITETLKKSAI